MRRNLKPEKNATSLSCAVEEDAFSSQKAIPVLLSERERERERERDLPYEAGTEECY